MASGVVDGALIVDTGIKNDKAKVGAKEFVSMIERMNQAANRAGQQMSGSVTGYIRAMNRARDAAKNMAGDQKAVAQEIIKAQTRLAKLEEKQALQRRKFESAREDAIGKAQEKFAKDNTGADLMPWEDEAQAMEQFSEDLNRVAQEAEAAFGTFEDTAVFRNTSNEIEYLREKLAGLQPEMTAAAQAEEGAASGTAEAAAQTSRMSEALAGFGASAGNGVSGFMRLAGSAGHAAASLAKLAGNGALSFLKKLAAGAKNAAVQMAKLAANAVKGGVKKLGGLIGGAAKSLLGFNKASQQSGGGLKQGLMTMMKYGLGIRSLFFLFRKLRTVASEGLGELSKRNPAVKASLDSLKGALNGLKGSLATAFAPIVTAVAPALTKLINMLTGAINTIGAFMAALTGQGTYQKAVAGLESTGSAASGAAGSVKELKRQLAGFDQLEILSANDNSSGGGGGGGSGSGYSYETEEIAGGITDFVSKLKQMWANADYEGIGREIAGCINNAFAKAKDLISWDNLGQKITEVVTGITGIINGLVDGIDWDLIGRTFGEGINTLIKTSNLLLTGINWENIGKGFADGLNGLVSAVKWDELGQLFANKLNALIGTIKGVVTNFKWGDAGTAFATTVNNLISTVKWGDVEKAASSSINGVISALRNAVKAFDWGAAGTSFGNLANGLVTGVDWEGIADTATASVNGIIIALRKAVNKFDWSYAGTSFGNLANGLVTGVDWDGVAALATDSVNGIITALRKAVNKFDWSYAATSFAKLANGLITGVDWDGVADLATDSANKIIVALRKFVNKFEWSYAGTSFGNTVNKLIADFNWEGLGMLASESIGGPIKALKDAVSTFEFGEAGTKFAETVNGFFSNKQLWEDAGTAVSEGIIGLFTSGASFFDEANTDQIAEDIRAFVGSIDWAGIAQAIWTFAVSAMRALGNLMLALIFGPGYKDKTAVQQEIEDYVSGLTADIDGERNFSVNFGLNLMIDDEMDAFNKLGDAIQEALNTGEWVAPVGLDVPDESIEAARQEFIKEWNLIHPKAPIDPTLPDNAGKQLSDGLKNKWDKLSANNKTLQVIGDLVKKSGITLGGVFGSVLEVSGKLLKDPASGSKKVADIFGSAVSFVANLTSTGSNWKEKGGVKKWFGNGNDPKATFIANLTGDGSNWKNKGSVKKWFGNGNDPVATFIANLTGTGSNWKQKGSVLKWFGETVKFLATLSKKDKKQSSGALFGTSYTAKAKLENADKKKYTPAKIFGTTLSVTATIVASGASAFKKKITEWAEAAKKKAGLATGGVISAGGGLRRFASGGVIRGGLARYLAGVPHYASGTTRAHGTVFVAGEAGPEIMGHINGRTEILNKSQIAEAIYAAVVAGMGRAVNALGSFLASRMGECANAIVETIGNVGVVAGLPDLSGLQYHAPAMATGTVLPYEVAAQVARSGAEIQNTLDANNEDLIQTIISVAGQIVAAVRASGGNESRGSYDGLSASQVIQQINRQTRMFGASPLEGV